MLVVAAVVATLVAGGPRIWADYVTLLRNVSDPITTPHNFTPGRDRLPARLPRASSRRVIQLARADRGRRLLVIVVALRGSAPASYLLAVTASQLLSPVLWDHYAMLLLLPVAYLLDRGQCWAVLVPLATCILLISVTPAAAYPIAFWVRDRRSPWSGCARAARKPPYPASSPA